VEGRGGEVADEAVEGFEGFEEGVGLWGWGGGEFGVFVCHDVVFLRSWFDFLR
jgi:hypothetical protein